MKTLVVYYSRHGHTRMIGEKIARILKAEVEEIIDKTDRTRIVSWAESAFDPDIKKPTQIEEPKEEVRKYDLVIIGTPIWDGMTPAVRRYLETIRLSEQDSTKIAFFATYGAMEGNTFKEMENLSKRPIAILGLQDRELILGEDKKKVQEFCDNVQKAVIPN